MKKTCFCPGGKDRARSGGREEARAPEAGARAVQRLRGAAARQKVTVTVAEQVEVPASHTW